MMMGPRVGASKECGAGRDVEMYVCSHSFLKIQQRSEMEVKRSRQYVLRGEMSTAEGLV